jgi:hypothetical protein
MCLSISILPLHNSNPELKSPFLMHTKVQDLQTHGPLHFLILPIGNPSFGQMPASAGAILYDPDSADDIDDDDPDEDLDI